MNRTVQHFARSRVAAAAFWLVVLPVISGTIMASVVVLFMLLGRLFVRLPGNRIVFVACCFFACGFVAGLRLAWPRFRDHWALIQQWRKARPGSPAYPLPHSIARPRRGR